MGQTIESQGDGSSGVVGAIMGGGGKRVAASAPISVEGTNDLATVVMNMADILYESYTVYEKKRCRWIKHGTQ